MSIKSMAEEYPQKLKLYDHVPNSGIVHLPERRFPAVAIQGDSLSIMLTAFEFFLSKAKEHNDEDMYYEAIGIAQGLKEHLLRYEAVLEKEGFEKPYFKNIKDINFEQEFENS